MATAHGSGSLVGRIAEEVVAPGHVTGWWLGGSGFVFKTPGGTQIYVDPYLSDIVRDIFGSARAFPPPIVAEQARPDIVISSHWHEDHLDPGAIPVIAQHSPTTRFIMPPSATAHALSWRVPRNRVSALSVGESMDVNDVTITAVPARHAAGIPGWEVPDAIGIVLSVAGLTLYHTGDTEYDVRLRRLRNQGFDAVMACINGVTGNMNAHEAALLAWHLGSGTVIPIHHILWAGGATDDEATLDPALFAETYCKLGGTGRVVIPEIGAPIDFSRDGGTSR
jgi:L-ascorbate 6-phosphate lactonase